MLYYPIIFSVHIRLTIPNNSCTLCINIGIDMQKNAYNSKKTLSCVINEQQNIPLFVIMPGYITHSNL